MNIHECAALILHMWTRTKWWDNLKLISGRLSLFCRQLQYVYTPFYVFFFLSRVVSMDILLLPHVRHAPPATRRTRPVQRSSSRSRFYTYAFFPSMARFVCVFVAVSDHSNLFTYRNCAYVEVVRPDRFSNTLRCSSMSESYWNVKGQD